MLVSVFSVATPYGVVGESKPTFTRNILSPSSALKSQRVREWKMINPESLFTYEMSFLIFKRS
jgi:hypothetical protein